ncbi:MAG: hypothetical protein NVSMB9_11910 [Isosphaeraceae bacterium]
MERGARALGQRGRWLRPLVRRVLRAFDGNPRPAALRVAAFLIEDRAFRVACDGKALGLSPGLRLPAVMWPAEGTPAGWKVPALTTPGELAAFLELEPGELDWFADAQGRGLRASSDLLRHYRYAWRMKAAGSARLIEAPKPRLKALQRRVLDAILALVPPHEAAHGFRAGRSVRTFAEPHSGRRIVLRLDLADFFLSVTAPRVNSVFLSAGYPEPVARLLTGLCTSRVPQWVWDDPRCPMRGPESWRTRRLCSVPHLP